MVTRVQFSVPGEKIDFMVVGGGDGKTVLQNYTALTGRPPCCQPGRFGLWLTTSFTTSYDEKTVRSFVDGMAERRIPLHVFHFDCYWMKENEWCNFDLGRGHVRRCARHALPDEERAELHICVWINPYIGQKSLSLKKLRKRAIS